MGIEADSETSIVDWLNLPETIRAVSLWDTLHDAKIVSITSSLLDRTMSLAFEIEHLREYHKLGEGFQFVLSLDGVQSARVIGYAEWPGGCPIPDGLSAQKQGKLVAEYQAKWREESGSWNEFEARITRVDKQVFSISDAALATLTDGPVAIRLCGHINNATYHEVYLRSETLRISGSDGQNLALKDFQYLGEKYWEAYSKLRESTA